MDNETISSLASQFIEETYQGTAEVYTYFGAFALFTYASLLHFGDEVEYMWNAKFTLTTALYLLSKYPVFVYIAIQIIGMLLPQTTFSRLCNGLIILPKIAVIFPLCGTQGLISMRAYALYEGYRPMMIALSVTFSAALISSIYAFIIPSCAAGAEPANIKKSVTLTHVHYIAIILSDLLAFVAVIRQTWGLWKLKRSAGFISNKDLSVLVLQQGILRFCTALLMGVTQIILVTFTSMDVANNFSMFQDVFSSLLLCEFTLDLRRRNRKNLVSTANQSALSTVSMSFRENPARTIQSAFSRLHNNIVAEMGEHSDLLSNEDAGSGEPNVLRDISQGADLDCDEAVHLEVAERPQ